MAKTLDREETKAIQGEVGATQDGIWGPETQLLFEKHYNLTPPPVATPTGEPPSPDYSSMVAYYGQPGDTSKHTRIAIPYPMRLSWDLTSVVTRITCHQKVAEPLSAMLEMWLKHFGTEGIERHGLDLYGGCYNNRTVRNGTSTSKHAWAAAIDIDPVRNGNSTPWAADKVGEPGWGNMPVDAVEIAKSLKWKHGGDEWGRDAMHFQYTK